MNLNHCFQKVKQPKKQKQNHKMKKAIKKSVRKLEGWDSFQISFDVCGRIISLVKFGDVIFGVFTTLGLVVLYEGRKTLLTTFHYPLKTFVQEEKRTYHILDGDGRAGPVQIVDSRCDSIVDGTLLSLDDQKVGDQKEMKNPTMFWTERDFRARLRAGLPQIQGHTRRGVSLVARADIVSFSDVMTSVGVMKAFSHIVGRGIFFPGDSGCVCTFEDKVVGILRGGDAVKGIAVICPIWALKDAFQFEACHS